MSTLNLTEIRLEKLEFMLAVGLFEDLGILFWGDWGQRGLEDLLVFLLDLGDEGLEVVEELV